MKKLTVLLGLVAYMCAGGQSQLAPPPGITTDSARNLYFNTLEETLPIHNGRVFYGYPGILEHAFYPSNGWQTGAVLFDGIWYTKLNMMYDSFLDELVILHTTSTPVRLISERVQEFKFMNLHFVRLQADKDNVIKTGFYQRVVDGPVTIWSKRSKKIEENIVDLAIERKFIVTDQYYAFKDGSYTPIHKQKQLLELMKDKRNAVVQHLKQQRLKFRKAKEESIVTMAEFYNQSSN